MQKDSLSHERVAYSLSLTHSGYRHGKHWASSLNPQQGWLQGRSLLQHLFINSKQGMLLHTFLKTGKGESDNS